MGEYITNLIYSEVHLVSVCFQFYSLIFFKFYFGFEYANVSIASYAFH